jgi:hypothetical protein
MSKDKDRAYYDMLCKQFPLPPYLLGYDETRSWLLDQAERFVAENEGKTGAITNVFIMKMKITIMIKLGWRK